jgi:hypothetical protein
MFRRALCHYQGFVVENQVLLCLGSYVFCLSVVVVSVLLSLLSSWLAVMIFFMCVLLSCCVNMLTYFLVAMLPFFMLCSAPVGVQFFATTLNPSGRFVCALFLRLLLLTESYFTFYCNTQTASNHKEQRKLWSHSAALYLLLIHSNRSHSAALHLLPIHYNRSHSAALYLLPIHSNRSHSAALHSLLIHFISVVTDDCFLSHNTSRGFDLGDRNPIFSPPRFTVYYDSAVKNRNFSDISVMRDNLNTVTPPKRDALWFVNIRQRYEVLPAVLSCEMTQTWRIALQ